MGSSDVSTIEPVGAEPDPAAGATAPGWIDASLQRVDTFETSDEVARLESLLAARAGELKSLRAELARARELVRDATQSFQLAATQAADPAEVSALRRQRELAVTRAVEAEAARAELGFRLDELLGHMAQLTGVGLASSPDPAVEPLDVTVARLYGTVRGLTSALAETEESRDMSGARLMLAEQDLAMLAGRARLLERELAEAREQGELASLQVRSLAEQDARAEREGNTTRITELERMLVHETEKGREVAAELARVVAERMVLREELTRAQADSAGLRSALSAITNELDAERTTGRRSATEQRTRAERLHDALREARQVLGELSGALDRASRPPPPEFRSGDDPSSDTTQPGMPTYIEAMEGLEELVALRDEHIRTLTTTLQLERDRLRSVERVLQSLEPSAHMLPSTLWNELIQLVYRRGHAPP